MGADGWEDVGRLPDQNQPIRHRPGHREAAHGHEAAGAVDPHGAEHRPGLPLHGLAQSGVVEGCETPGRALPGYPDQTGPVTAGSGTRVKGPDRVWNSVETSRCGRAWARIVVIALCG